MLPSVTAGVEWSSTTGAASATRADCAIADYSRHVAAELAVVDPDANRDDVDLVGHRATEVTLEERAA